jgi:hypothetical protein
MGRLLNLSRLSQALRLPREWLKAEALAGRLPCLRVGRRLRFDAEAVEQALSERACHVPSPLLSKTQRD